MEIKNACTTSPPRGFDKARHQATATLLVIVLCWNKREAVH